MIKTTPHLATALATLTLTILSGCASAPEGPLQAVNQVDIPRFMGNWYVIAGIPTFPERNAYNPLEHYELNPNGSIKTTFTFNKNAPDGPKKTLNMTAFVNAKPNNGVWGMQWIWPIKADYRIAHLDADYQTTIIARNKRDYLWIMARTPGVDQRQLDELLELATALGYDQSKIQLTNWQTPTQEAE